MIILRAIWKIINNPPDYRWRDQSRQAAVDYIRSLNLKVFIDARPQGSPDLCVVLSPLGGTEQLAINRPLHCLQTAFELSVYSKHRANRTAADLATEVGQNLATILCAYRGERDGLNISEICPEGAPVHRADYPREASDDWTSIITYTYNVTHEQPRGDAIVYHVGD